MSGAIGMPDMVILLLELLGMEWSVWFVNANATTQLRESFDMGRL